MKKPRTRRQTTESWWRRLQSRIDSTTRSFADFASGPSLAGGWPGGFGSLRDRCGDVAPAGCLEPGNPGRHVAHSFQRVESDRTLRACLHGFHSDSEVPGERPWRWFEAWRQICKGDTAEPPSGAEAPPRRQLRVGGWGGGGGRGLQPAL